MREERRPAPCTIENFALNFGLTFGSPTATPSMRPLSSCSTARTEAPPPFETLEAMTIVLRLVNLIRRRSNCSFSMSNANSIERSTFLPQSFSGFCCECACLKAKRFGVAALNAVRCCPRCADEVRVVARRRGVGALAAHQVDGVVLQVVCAGAGALVGIGDGAAALEAPLARGRDRAVDAARAGRGRGDDAGVRRVEAVRHLHHHGDVRAAAAPFSYAMYSVPAMSPSLAVTVPSAFTFGP